jgi:hypothetical protein
MTQIKRRNHFTGMMPLTFGRVIEGGIYKEYRIGEGALVLLFPLLTHPPLSPPSPLLVLLTKWL